MSTKLGSIPDLQYSNFGFNGGRATLQITRFSGGESRGTCISLVTIGDSEYSSVQLTKNQALELAKIIQEGLTI